MIKVLVIGGAGYVGSDLVSYLACDKRTSVTVFDNMMCGGDALISIPGINILRGDVRDAGAVREAVREHNVVVHMASIVGYPACDIDPEFSYAVNVGGTENVVSALSKQQPIIFCSTTSSYGNKSETVTEKTRLSPLTVYGKTKAEAEKIVLKHHPHIVFRPATAFGVAKRLRLDLLPNALSYMAIKDRKIELYEPDVVRPFIHVCDFARALYEAVVNSFPWNEVYNLGDPSLVVTKRWLAKTICTLSGADLTIVDGLDKDRRNYNVSFDKIAACGFRSIFTLEYGYRQVANLAPVVDDRERYTTPFYVRRFLECA